MTKRRINYWKRKFKKLFNKYDRNEANYLMFKLAGD